MLTLITPEQRRQKLKDLRIVVAAIARTCEVKPPAVFQVLANQRPNPPIRLAICAAIAEKTGQTVDAVMAEFFPEPKAQEKVAA